MLRQEERKEIQMNGGIVFAHYVASPKCTRLGQSRTRKMETCENSASDKKPARMPFPSVEFGDLIVSVKYFNYIKNGVATVRVL